jgi:hypothetical protein
MWVRWRRKSTLRWSCWAHCLQPAELNHAPCQAVHRPTILLPNCAPGITQNGCSGRSTAKQAAGGVLTEFMSRAVMPGTSGTMPKLAHRFTPGVTHNMEQPLQLKSTSMVYSRSSCPGQPCKAHLTQCPNKHIGSHQASHNMEQPLQQNNKQPGVLTELMSRAAMPRTSGTMPKLAHGFTPGVTRNMEQRLQLSHSLSLSFSLY